MTDYFRQLIGVKGKAPASAASKNRALAKKEAQVAQENKTYDERSNILLKTQKMRITALEHQIVEADQKIAELRKAPNVDWAKVKVLLAQKEKHKQELTPLMSKYEALQMQAKMVQATQENLEQGMLMKEAASKLTETTKAMEQLDIEQAADDIGEASALVEEHNGLLTSPSMFGGVHLQDERDEAVDIELARMMQEQADAAAADLPDASVDQPTIKKTTKSSAAAKEK